MRIKNLKIQEYKNLKDFDCDFSDSNIIALIGDNGSGKSNVLEFLAMIFAEAKNLNSNTFPFHCDLEYEIDSSTYRLHFSYVFQAFKDDKLDIKKLDSFLPKVVFTYYAGETPRMRNIASQCIDKKYDIALKRNEEIDFKFLTYLSMKDLDISFLTSYLFKTEIYNKVAKFLGITAVNEHPIYLRIKKPAWASKTGTKDNYWGATGFVKEFLDKLTESTEENGISVCVKLPSDETDNFFLGINKCNLFRDLFKTPLEMFIKLKALKEADILDFIVIATQKGDVNPHLINYSEGEKQLANLLFILDLTKEYKALFLLDEFDSYLHPNWQREFVSLISQIDIRGQIIFTTHSPASISKMKSSDVIIMDKGKAKYPISETYNRSLEEIMEENMKISLRPKEYEKLVEMFRNAIVHGNKEKANTVLDEIKGIIGEEDPFLITARIALNRMN
jgi:ABC-type multidrug transport system ATPase subunit